MSQVPARIRKVAGRLLLACLVLSALPACAARDDRHEMIVSVHDQRLLLLEDGEPVRVYPISTSKYGLGDGFGSYATPLGKLEVARKIGATAPSGAVFKDRKFTGEVLPPDAPGRDPIVSRIIWLRGNEPVNQNAFSRYIYIHGTTEEKRIGEPVSYGCIRMRSRDVIELFETVGVGARIEIIKGRLDRSQVKVASSGAHPGEG